MDQQFMDQMGSPFLLAHGLGTPVADAITVSPLLTRQTYRLHVRTRDWVAPHGPGRFVVQLTDGQNVLWSSKELGVGKGTWHWEDCGEITIPEETREIRLHDLTGFDGRCDALLFVPSGMSSPFEGATKDDFSLRRQLLGLSPERQMESFDFVVVGGGYAGLCAAVAAARQGVRTALVHDREVFGGNGSNEVRVGPIGRMGLPPFPRNSDLAYELSIVTKGHGITSGGLRPPFDDEKLLAWLEAEECLTLYRGWRSMACTTTSLLGNKLQLDHIVIRNVRTSQELKLSARCFSDCTGDAILAEHAGAELRTEPESGETLKGGYGSTNFWTTRWTAHETDFPVCPWALQMTEQNWNVSVPKCKVEGDYPYAAGWNWESGFDKDAVRDGEAIRDLNFRAAYGMWDFLKNRSPDRARYACAEMDWLGIVLGKRAARRIVGDYVLSEKDLTESTPTKDGVVTTTWFLDLHMPHPTNVAAFGADAFRSIAYDDPNYAKIGDAAKGRLVSIKPYAIPYRCFYSRNVQNLFMAGKNVSASHVGMASVRVENTCAQMGAMVGRAAALCVRNGWTPRELGAHHWDALVDLLKNPGRLTRLAKWGQGRVGLKGEMKYWLRVVYHKVKKMLGRPYLEEFAG